MEDQIERGLKGFQDSRSSSKWSKSFLWKWSWLKQRSAFLSISGQFNFIPSASICHVSRYFLASDLMNLMMSHPRRHDIDAKQRLENEFVHVSLLQRSWGRECKCIFAMVECWTHKKNTQNIGYYVYIYIRICLNRTSFYRHVGVPFTICHQSMPCRWVPSLAAEVVEPWHAQWCQKGVWGRGHADLAFAFKGLATCCACFSGLCGRMSVSEWSL